MIIGILKKISSAVLLLSLTITARSETFVVEKERVEIRALEYNPLIRAMAEEAAGKKTRNIEVMTPFNPTLMLGSGGQSEALGIGGRASTTMMWDQKWRFPGKSLIDLAAIKADNRAADLLVNLASREALWRARKAYWDYVENQQSWDLRRKAEEQWKFFNELLVSKGLAGQWLSMKVIRAQLGLATDSNDFITSGKALNVSKAALKHVLGLPAETKFNLGQVKTLPRFKEKLAVLRQQVLNEHPSVLLARQEVETKTAERTSARMEFLPDLTSRVQTTGPEGTGGPRQYGLRLGISVPLGFAQGARASRANYKVEEAKFKLQAVQDEIGHYLEEAFVRAEASWRLKDLYDKGGLIQQIKQGWFFAQGAWENENIKLSDYIESYDIYLDTRLAYIRTRAAYGRDMARLEYETGIFTKRSK